MSDVTVQIKQFTARYQTALIAKTAVWGALTLGVAAACWWRLHRLDASPWWSLGVPTALSLVSAVGLAWWLGQRWLSVHDAADRLDHTLGLQQRLVTTLEFADTQPPPALYPLLVDDTAHAFSTQAARVPRPIDRASVGLAVVLLVLLLWPFKGTEPIRLAGLPGLSPTTPPPQPDIPPPQPQPPPPQDQQQDQQQDQRQDQRQGQGQDQQPQAQGTPESNQGQGEQTQQDQQGQGGQKDHQDRGGGQQQQQASDGTSQQEQRSADSGSAEQRADSQEASSGDQSQRAASPSSHGQQRPGGQDALKADIQQLLKELSGELKDLQEQLAAAEAQSPEAGTSTDPQLYGAPEPMARADGSSLPIQLKTDTAETSAQRPSGGLAEPSGEIAGAAPQLAPEIAEMSPDSLEQSAVTRQRVPPEYQSVFDRLFRRNQQPSEPQQP